MRGYMFGCVRDGGVFKGFEFWRGGVVCGRGFIFLVIIFLGLGRFNFG